VRTTIGGEPLRLTKDLKNMMVTAEREHDERGEAEDSWDGHGHKNMHVRIR
jgi:hypothetical protein